MNRRDFLKIGTVSATAVALGGCSRPMDTPLVSQVDMPEIRLIGKPRYFATTCQECRGGCGVSVKIVDGRAKKLEGIPTHPISHGKVCARGQSVLQALYNPDRLPVPRRNGQVSDIQWEDALHQLATQMQASMAKPGSTLWVTGRLNGSAGRLVSLAAKVGAKIWNYEFPGHQAERTAVNALTGGGGVVFNRLDDADYVVNFGSDFLMNGHSPVRDAWAYGEFRGGKTRGVIVSFGPHMNMTVANSDKWVPVRPGSEGWIALGVANLLAKGGKKGFPDWVSSITPDVVAKIAGSTITEDLLNRLARRLSQARRPLAIGGGQGSTYTNGTFTLWAINLLNKVLRGSVDTFEPDLLIPLPGEAKIDGAPFISTKQAIDGLKASTFDTVWFFDSNPVYSLPAKIDIVSLLVNITNMVAFTPYENETTKQLPNILVLPTTSWLEEWGDNRVDGPFGPGGKTVSVYGLQQGLVERRPNTLSTSDILLLALQRGSDDLKKVATAGTTMDLLHSRLATGWEQTVARGGVWDDYPLDWEPYRGRGPMAPPPAVASVGTAPAGVSPWEGVKGTEFTAGQEAKFDGQGFVLLPYAAVGTADGSLANRPWMQELPDSMTHLLWSDWIEINSTIAQTRDILEGDIIRLTSSAGTIEGGAYPTPGVHAEAVAVPIGQGHTSYGRYAGRGMGVTRLIVPQFQQDTGELAWSATRVHLETTGRKMQLIDTNRREGEMPRKFFG